MENQYVTVQKFAQLAGKTPQAIYKQVDNRLNPFVKLVDNRKMIDIKALEEIYDIKVEQPFNQNIQPGFNLDTQNNELEKQLNEENTFLKFQIEEKDKQIQSLQAQLKEKDEQIKSKDLQLNLTIQSLQFEQAQNQKLLEAPKKTWWQKLFKKTPRK